MYIAQQRTLYYQNDFHHRQKSTIWVAQQKYSAFHLVELGDRRINDVISISIKKYTHLASAALCTSLDPFCIASPGTLIQEWGLDQG